MTQSFVRIAIIDNKLNQAEERKIFIDETPDWPVVVKTEVFTNADDLIEAVESRGAFFDVIVSDVFMPGRCDSAVLDEGTPEKGGIRVKTWLSNKRSTDTDFRNVQLLWISRHSDVSDFIQDHANYETYSWFNHIEHHDKRSFYPATFRPELGRRIRMANPGSLDLDLPSDFIVASPEMTKVMAQARRVAGSDASVLITGPNGSGKEKLAHFVHLASPRRSQSFLPLNCAAIPSELIESELFGYEKGAFTGATTRRAGMFQRANGGTLFLDEIGDMTPSTQSKVLRALEDKTFQPLGGKEVLRSEVRIISATNRHLKDMIGAGTFREDLYYRISVLELKIPSLRDRARDVPPLVEYFLRAFAVAYAKGFLRISPEALSVIESYSWPGNVRQLRNAIERAVVFAELNGVIEPEDLPPDIAESATAVDERGPSRAEMRVCQALLQSDFNQSKAATLLGVTRAAVSKYIKKHSRVRRFYESSREMTDARSDRLREMEMAQLPPRPTVKGPA